MTCQFVFVRFFFGYPASFPFERFIHLKDDDLKRAVEALGKAWLTEQGVEDLQVSGDLLHNITRRYAVERFDTKEVADDAAAALQDRMAELDRAIWAKHHWSDDDAFLASVKPRFFVVAEEELLRPERIRAREQIDRTRGSAEGNRTLEEGLLRHYWPTICATLEQVRAVELSANDLGESQPARGTAAREALDPQPVQDDPPEEEHQQAASIPHAEIMRGAASETRPRSDTKDPPEPCRPKLEEVEGYPVRVINEVLSVRIVGNEDQPAKPPDADCITSHGNRCYQIGGNRPVVLGEAMDDVLQSFLKHPAMDEGQLVKISGRDDAVKVLRKLAVWQEGMFAPAIHSPPGKSSGGYHVNIRRA